MAVKVIYNTYNLLPKNCKHILNIFGFWALSCNWFQKLKCQNVVTLDFSKCLFCKLLGLFQGILYQESLYNYLELLEYYLFWYLLTIGQVYTIFQMFCWWLKFMPSCKSSHTLPCDDFGV